MMIRGVRGRRATPWALLLAIALLGIAPGSAGALPGGFQESTPITGLTYPTSVRFSSDGRVFVAEKSGLIKVFDSLTDPTPTTFADLRGEVYDYWDRGLLGLALDPNFPAQPYVYALYTYQGASSPSTWTDACPTPPGPNSDGCPASARLSRLTASGDVMSNKQVLINDWCIQFPSHSIGDLAFGPEGALYVGGGDGASFTTTDTGQYGNPVNPCGDPSAEGGALRSQDVRTSGDPTGPDGSILRIDPATGNPWPGNPLGGDSNAQRIIATGLRNPFRFTIRPGTSEVWLGDVGWNDWEEIDRIPEPGSPLENFGWPCYEGAGSQAGYDNLNVPVCEGLYGQSGAVTNPYFTYRHSTKVVSGETCPTGSSSLAGMAFYPGGSYPSAYHGALFFADYSRDCIWAMRTAGGSLPSVTAIETFDAPAANPVNMQIGPGSDLYYVDYDGGTIRRIRYLPGNQTPTAVAAADPTFGPAPLTVDFDATGSTDPNGDPLTYAWDLDGDGSFDDSTSPTPSRTYNQPGNRNVGLIVSDGLETDADSVSISAGNEPPTATIGSPSSSLLWRVGQQIDFSGSATDPQQGSLPASAFSWSLDLQHCPSNCHTHHIQDFVGTETGSFAAPDHDYPSYLTLRLTVTDAGGLTDTKTIQLSPKAVYLTMQSNPTGLDLVLNGSAQEAPFTRTVILGSRNSLSAPETQQAGDVTYLFDSWSDSGARSHDVTAYGSAAYTAAYDNPLGGFGVMGIEAVPPNTRIVRGPKGRTRNATPVFGFRAVPPNPDTRFKCNIDGRKWKRCESPRSFRTLSAGAHTFRVRAIDSDGNRDPTPAKRTFTVEPTS